MQSWWEPGNFIRTPYARALMALLIMSIVLIGVVIIIYKLSERSSESSRENATLLDILKKIIYPGRGRL